MTRDVISASLAPSAYVTPDASVTIAGFEQMSFFQKQESQQITGF